MNSINIDFLFFHRKCVGTNPVIQILSEDMQSSHIISVMKFDAYTILGILLLTSTQA